VTRRAGHWRALRVLIAPLCLRRFRQHLDTPSDSTFGVLFAALPV